jgi:hypothetical protein
MFIDQTQPIDRKKERLPDLPPADQKPRTMYSQVGKITLGCLFYAGFHGPPMGAIAV